MESNSESLPQKNLQVEIDPQIQDRDYDLKFDVEKLQQVFPEGLKINKISIKKGKSLAIGKFNYISRELSLYPDVIWNMYNKAITAAEKSVQDNKPLSEQNIFTTKRLSKYLQTAPPDRAIEFTKRLAQISLNRMAKEIMFHETSHSQDTAKDVVLAITSHALVCTGGTALLSEIVEGIIEKNHPINETQQILLLVMQLFTWVNLSYIHYSYLNQNEKVANKFAKQKLFVPDWQDIISMRPKENVPERP